MVYRELWLTDEQHGGRHDELCDKISKMFAAIGRRQEMCVGFGVCLDGRAQSIHQDAVAATVQTDVQIDDICFALSLSHTAPVSETIQQRPPKIVRGRYAYNGHIAR